MFKRTERFLPHLRQVHVLEHFLFSVPLSGKWLDMAVILLTGPLRQQILLFKSKPTLRRYTNPFMSK